MKSLNAYQLSGLLLIAGIVLTALSGILSPGVLLIDMLLVTEAQDLYDRLDVKVDNAEITHVTASVYILGHILLMGGVSALWMGLRGGSAGDALMRMGILALGVAFVCGIASAILDHIMVHIVLHGNTAGLSEAEYQPLALGVNVTDMAVEMMLLITTFIGHALLAVGLATKFAPGLRKSAAIAVSLISLAALVAVVIGSHEHGLGILVAISALGLAPTTAWLIALGVWLYREDPELVGDPAGA